MNILVATQNKGKIREYQRLFADVDINFIGLADIGLGDMDVEENGTTFEENATIKARAYANASNHWTLADDSGLMVDALNGAPGIYSKRYGGDDMKPPQQRIKMLGELADIPDEKRGAKFVCVIALAKPHTNDVMLVRGECPGSITHQEFDEGNGFGYDPIFKPNGYDKTFGQMPAHMKNGLSHRAIAAEKALPILRKMLEETL